MIIKSNLHTHTQFCDGKASAESIVEEAIRLGFHTIGFSSHSYTDFDPAFCMSKENTIKYIAEIGRLKKEYYGKIDILLGCEVDYFSNIDLSAYEYIIGSLHYVQKDGLIINIDGPVDRNGNLCDIPPMIDDVNTYFGGDFYECCKNYYELLAGVVKKTHADVIGHFDIITKFNTQYGLWDEDDRRYTDLAYGALECLLKEEKPFEINTGAMFKKIRTVPYPAPRYLKYIAEHKGSIVFSSDAHTPEALSWHQDDMVELAKFCGFKSAKVMSKNGFEDILL